jgi:hypothetical protein
MPNLMAKNAKLAGLGKLLDTWQAAIEHRDLTGLHTALWECLEAPLDAESVHEAELGMQLALLACAAAGFVVQAWRIAWEADLTPEFFALDLGLGVRERHGTQERRWRQGRRGHC